MPPLLTDEQVSERIEQLRRILAFTEEAIAGMLTKRTAREVLRRLERTRRARQSRHEREDHRRWLAKQATERTEALEEEHALIASQLKRDRDQMTLSERVDALLNQARLAQEGTQGTHYDAKTTAGHRVSPIPSLDGTPLVDEVAELLTLAIERAEEEVDHVMRCLPRMDRIERNRAVLDTPGKASLVAMRFGCTESHVEKLRAGEGLRRSDGTPKPERREKAA